MKTSLPTGLNSFKVIASITSVTFAFPVTGLADLRLASEPEPPPTPLDARNALFAFMIHWLLLAIATVALAWLIWWGVRMRRK